MIIGKLWDFEYPWDVRVEKVTDALVAAGHEVHLFCRNRKGQPLRERLGALEVHRMPNWPRAGSWLDDVSSFPAFVNPRWARHVLRSARAARVELLLCRDLPLAPLAIWAGRRLGVPVVVDIAENYPAMLRHRFHWREFRPHNLLVRNPVLATAVERWVMRRADGVLAVVEESRDRLIEVGAPADRVEVVCNTPTAERIDAMTAIADARGAADGPLRLVYLGLLGISRGIDVTLRALQALDARGADVHLDVIGTVGRGLDYRAVAQELGVARRVTFHGHVPYDDALAIVARADVGLVPHHATEHWRTTIPNKLFDYMAAGLPVLVSDAPPTRRIVEESACGLVFRDRDERDFADRVVQLLDAGVRRRMGEAGRRAVRDRYNWDLDGARLVARLERVRAEAAAGAVRERSPSSAASDIHRASRAADTTATAR